MNTPVIGLDRDGTINQDIGLTEEGVPPYCIKPEQFKPIPGSLEAIKMIRDKGYDVVILTNQSGIQKGLYDAVDVDIVHNYMLQLLAEVGCKSINGLYYSTISYINRYTKARAIGDILDILLYLKLFILY